jgi:hypothetical protein
VVILGGGPEYLDCDSFAVAVIISINNYKPPYTITATAPDGKVFTHVLTAPGVAFGGIIDTFRIRHHLIPNGNQTLSVTATNGCGISGTGPVFLDAGFAMSALASQIPGCGSQLAYTFELNKLLHCPTVTYTLVSPSGALLATQTNNSTFSGFPPAPGYKVVRQDCCQKDSLQFNWAGGTAFAIDAAMPFAEATCKEGTAGLVLFFNVNDRQGDIVVASGPPSMTLADGTVHPLTYPDTIKNVPFNQLTLNYFTIGTYKIYAITSCGEKDSTTVTIGPSNLRHSQFSA